MELPPIPQNPHSSATGVPDGFAIVPLHLFLLIAHQIPFLPATMTVTTIAKPMTNDSLYERAMSCSSN